VPPEWADRYQNRWEEYRLPKIEQERLKLGEQVAQDGYFLFSAICADEPMRWLRSIPAVETLRCVWLQNFYQENDCIHWRRSGNIPPAAQYIRSPFDTQARFSVKRGASWVGYKVHLTETCDADSPHLITHVITTAATDQDNSVVNELHHALAEKDLTPSEHLMDQGYSDSHELLQAREQYDIELVMPMRTDHAWQKTTGGYDWRQFHIDWDAQQVTCPQGKTSGSWVLRRDKKGYPRYEVMFNASDCSPCLARALCTKSKRHRRKLTFRPQIEQTILDQTRAYQQTDEFQERYATRAGIEGTIGGMRSRWRTLKSDIVGEFRFQAAAAW
jgi:transposase